MTLPSGVCQRATGVPRGPGPGCSPVRAGLPRNIGTVPAAGSGGWARAAIPALKASRATRGAARRAVRREKALRIATSGGERPGTGRRRPSGAGDVESEDTGHGDQLGRREHALVLVDELKGLAIEVDAAW